MNLKHIKTKLSGLNKKVTAGVLALTMTAMTIIGAGLMSSYGADGNGNQTGGANKPVGDNAKGGYTVWFDDFSSGDAAQGWDEDSIAYMKNLIEKETGRTMHKEYVPYYEKAAQDALAEAKARSKTGRARVVGAIGVYTKNVAGKMTLAKFVQDFKRFSGMRPGTASELPDSSGWSVAYNNDDNSPDWRNYIYKRGIDNAGVGSRQLTVIVYAVAEGEPQAYEAPSGKAKLVKVSAIHECTVGNSLYNMVGAKYGIYSDENATTLVQEVTIDNADGTSAEVTLPTGTYYVKELAGSAKGYLVNDGILPFTVKSGETSTVTMDGTMAEEPINDPMTLVVQKASSGFDNAGEASGDTPDLSGVQFKIEHYPNETGEGEPDASAIFETNNEGLLEFTTATPVEGTWPFKTKSNDNTFPLGYVKITEVKSKPGLVTQGATSFVVVDDNGHAVIKNAVLFGDNAANVKTKEGVKIGAHVDGVWKGGITVVKADRDLDGQPSKPEGDGSLAGIKYSIVNKSINKVHVDGKTYEKGQEVMQITTKLNEQTGRYEATTGANVLPYGTYDIIEVEANESYNKGDYVKTISIREDGEMVILDKDSGELQRNINAVKRGGVSVTKFDRELGQSKPLGEAKLDGVVYEIVNKSQNDVVVDGKTYKVDEVVKTIATEFDEETKTYVAKTGKNDLPYGTYEVREVSSSKGYLLDKESKAWKSTFSIREEGEVKLFDKAESSSNNQVIREDFYFNKKADDTAERMNNVAFLVTSKTTGEKHIIVTDENGQFKSSANDNTNKTNSNDPDSPITNGAIEIDANGNYVVKDASKLDNEAGTWFTGAKPSETHWAKDGRSYTVDGSDKIVEVKDDLRSFPYDTYTVEELRSEANKGYNLVNVTVTLHKYGNHESNGIELDYGTIDDQPIDVKTTLTYDGTHLVPASESVNLVDRVEYSGLTKGTKALLKGELHAFDAEDNDLGVVAKAEKEFDVTSVSGNVEVNFDNVNTLDEKAEKFVAYEFLYQNGQLVAEHKDPKDPSQTVTKPQIKTNLSGDIEQEANASSEIIKLVDKVTYKGLEVGKNYNLIGTLMNQETGKAFLDKDGKEITATTTFAPTKSEGSVDVVFEFKNVDIAGKTVVAFETLEHNGKKLAVHADINDENQTVTLPKVKTNATSSNGLKEIAADKEQKIIDRVTLSNLIVGKTYKLSATAHAKSIDGKDLGELKDKDGKAIVVEKEFTADSKDMVIDMEVTVDASLLGGHSAVMFEKLSRDGVVVGLHADITDEDQTVKVPKVGTTLTDESGSHTVNTKAGTEVTLNDVIAYSNLTVGTKYTAEGELHIAKVDKDGNVVDGGVLKDKNGKPVVATAEFTPEKTEGTATVTFKFNVDSLDGIEKVVAFETVKNGDIIVATHADIKDANQTVTFKVEPKPEQPTNKVKLKTGLDSYALVLGAVLVVTTIVAGTVLTIKRRKFDK